MKNAPETDEAFELPADFAERVLREVDRRSRRNRVLAGTVSGAAALALVAVALVHPLRPGPHRLGVQAGQPLAHRSASAAVRGSAGSSLSADDLAWLEQVGSEPSDPESVVFPDALSADTSREADPLVAVAENL